MMIYSNNNGGSSAAGFMRKGKLPAQAAAASTAEVWELRPGGMLVQKRDPDAEAAHAGPLIRVKVSYASSSRYISIGVHSTFAELKKALVQDTGLQPEQQRLLYKGKERKNNASLHEAGLKNKSKIVLVEDKTGWERRLVELRNSEAAAKACKAVSEVQQLVDKLSGQIVSIEAAVLSGKKLTEKEFTAPTDLLMCQMVKLDGSKVDGDAKVQKRILTRRIQKYVERLDALKVQNDSSKVQKAQQIDKRNAQSSNGVPNIRHDKTNTSNLVRIHSNTGAASNTVVTTSWETFGGSSGGVSVKPAVPVNELLLIQWD